MSKRQAKKRSPATPPRSREIVPEVLVEDAVDLVEQWILAGKRDREIVRLISREFPQFDAAMLYQAAVLKLGQNAALPDAAVFGFCIAATMQIYNRTIANGEHKLALDAIKQLAALQKSKPAPDPSEDQPEGESDC